MSRELILKIEKLYAETNCTHDSSLNVSVLLEKCKQFHKISICDDLNTDCKDD